MIMKKRLLYIVNVDWFFISHRLPIAIEALKSGYEVHIACGITDKKEYLEELGLIVHPLKLSRSGTSIGGELSAFLEIYHTLKVVNPYIVHFVSIKPILYGGICSRFLPVYKKVFSISGLGYVFTKRGIKAFIVRKLIKTMYKIALGGKNSTVIVQNSYDKEVILSICPVCIEQIRGSGVDLDMYKDTSVNNTSTVVTMASRLLKDKGVYEYLTAANLLKEQGIDATFELYGDIDVGNLSSLTGADIKKIKKEGIVKLMGFSKDISLAFSHTSIVVLPSYREGLPKVLIEAAACGKAIVTTDVPGCKDAIVHNKTGLLCKERDALSLAQQIKKLVLDKNLCDEMGKAGRIWAEQEFDIKKVIEKHLEIYRGSK